MALLVAALVAPLLVALTGVPAAPPAQAAVPVRILVVGDSITQGSSGDWTWRYRLARHLAAAGVAFDLVGPRTDLYDNVAGEFGSQAYLDPAFDRDHAARWGMLLGDMDVSISELVTTYQPDVVLTLLGDNDLSAGATPAEVGAMLSSYVGAARAAKSGVDVVLGEDPRPHTQPGAPALNDEIEARAAALDSAAERVVVADPFTYDYDDLTDTWDGAHPNARGELKLAAAFEDALHEVDGSVPAAAPVPDVPLGPRVPPVLSAAAGTSADAVQLSWTRSPGSQASEVWARDVTAGEAFHLVAGDVTGTGYVLTGRVAGHAVAVYTVPYKGFWPAEPDAWSNVVQFPPPATTPPATTPPALTAVRHVRLRVTGRRTWRATGDPVPGATSYTLRAATVRRCGHEPRQRRFTVVAAGLAAPARRFHRRAAAVWVQWVAVRDGGEGVVGPSSTACAERTP